MSSKKQSQQPEAGLLAGLVALLEITRPLNCLISFLSVLLGGWLAMHTLDGFLLLAACSATLLMAGGNVLNDLWDQTSDGVNHPERPLPSNRLSSRVTRAEAIALLALGCLLALPLPPPTPGIAVLACALLITYNGILKNIPLAGNLAISLLCGAAFLFGGYAVDDPLPALIPAIFATVFHFGREILKDLQDMEGDLKGKGSTLPIWASPRAARATISITYLVLIFITLYPFKAEIYGPIYLFLVLFLDFLLISVVFEVWQSDSPGHLRRLSHRLKWGMLLGILSIFLDDLFRHA
jgi:geranylgeranylglycerol-phosphate geranylgeranyltransferase